MNGVEFPFVDNRENADDLPAPVDPKEDTTMPGEDVAGDVMDPDCGGRLVLIEETEWEARLTIDKLQLVNDWLDDVECDGPIDVRELVWEDRLEKCEAIEDVRGQ